MPAGKTPGIFSAHYPSVARAWVDQGYKKTVAEDAAGHGIDVRVYVKDPAVKGFAATPRWPVERTYGWLMLHRRLDRDFETLPQRSIAQIHWAMIDNMGRRLTKETTPTWRTPASTTDLPAAAYIKCPLSVQEHVQHRAPRPGLLDHRGELLQGLGGGHDGAYADGLEVRAHRLAAAVGRRPL